MADQQLADLNKCIQNLSTKLEEVECRYRRIQGRVDIRTDPSFRQDMSTLQSIFGNARGLFNDFKDQTGALDVAENAAYCDARAAIHTKLKDIKSRIKNLKSQYKATADKPSKTRKAQKVDQVQFQASGDIESNLNAQQGQESASSNSHDQQSEKRSKQRQKKAASPEEKSAHDEKTWWKRISKSRLFFWKKSLSKSKDKTCKRNQPVDVLPTSKSVKQVEMENSHNRISFEKIADSQLPLQENHGDLAVSPSVERNSPRADELQREENEIDILTAYGRGLIQESKESLKRSVSTVETTTRCASDTMIELQDQTKSMERIDKDMEEVQADLKASKTAIRALVRESYCDRCHIVLLAALFMCTGLVILHETGLISLR